MIFLPPAHLRGRTEKASHLRSHMAFQSSEQRWKAAVFASVYEASLNHAGRIGLTLEIGSVLKKILIFSTGIGSVVAGGVLTWLTCGNR